MKWMCALTLAFAVLATAQAPGEGGPAIGQRLKQNAEALKQYTYKRRVEVSMKGKSRGARVDQVSYVDGRMETVPLQNPGQSSGSGRGGGLRGMMKKKKMGQKKEGMKEDVERLTALFQRYMSPGDDSMRSLLEKAVISRTGPEANADIKVVATGVVSPSDSFTLLWNVANRRPAQIDIRSDLDGKPVRFTVAYASLPGGHFYPEHTLISVPNRELTIAIDQFDYMHAGPAK